MSERVKKVSHRNHFGRNFQKTLEPLTPYFINKLSKSNLLLNTHWQDVQESGEILTPDDITITGLQLSLRAVKNILENGNSPENRTLAFTGLLLDGLDGNYARFLKLNSITGPAKDAIVDRRFEIEVFKMITQKRSNYPNKPENLESLLLASSFLSTLTKAYCEMGGFSY